MLLANRLMSARIRSFTAARVCQLTYLSPSVLSSCLPRCSQPIEKRSYCRACFYPICLGIERVSGYAINNGQELFFMETHHGFCVHCLIEIEKREISTTRRIVGISDLFKSTHGY